MCLVNKERTKDGLGRRDLDIDCIQAQKQDFWFLLNKSLQNLSHFRCQPHLTYPKEYICLDFVLSTNNRLSL